METCRIAIPSTMPGGLDSALGEHFGHCDWGENLHMLNVNNRRSQAHEPVGGGLVVMTDKQNSSTGFKQPHSTTAECEGIGQMFEGLKARQKAETLRIVVTLIEE